MLIKVSKSGLYAHPEPCRGVVALRQGKLMNVDTILGADLITNKWATCVDVARLTKADLVSLGASAELTKAEMINDLGLL